jgi:hypothetical protein
MSSGGASGSGTSSGGSGGATGGATSSTGGSGGTGTTGGDGGPCLPPGILRPSHGPPNSLNCPFAAEDGGTVSGVYCDPSIQHCCEEPEGGSPSTCEPLSSPCTTGPGYISWGCVDPLSDCPTGGICCAYAATLELGGTVNGMQCANTAPLLTTTKCVSPSGYCVGIQLCTMSSECPAAKPTCTPFTAGRNEVGGCL